jgi:ATP-dependent RNA helicase DeaD
MLDMGFLEDLQAIFDFLPKKRQTLMFSATMPPAIQALAQKILSKPAVVKVSPSQTTNADIEQHYCVLHDSERDEAVIRLFEARDMGKTILFCKTKKEVDRLLQVLTKRGQSALALHGDMEQNQREQVIQNFRSGACMTLIATDVAARGINIVDVAHVINYHIPFDPENYVHRIGRTGRAGRKGVSITFVTPKEYPKLVRFQKVIQSVMNPMLIPSKKEIRSLQIEKVLQQAKQQVPSPELLSLLSRGLQNTELLAAQLLDCILSKNPIEGAETIGITDPISAKKEFSSRDRRKGKEKWDRPAFKPKKKFSPSFAKKSFKKKSSFK